MTKDEIIKMLRASCDKDRVDPEQNGFWVIVTEELEAFVKLVAAAEREACAKLCDVLAVHPEYASEVTKLAAQAIRNRGQL